VRFARAGSMRSPHRGAPAVDRKLRKLSAALNDKMTAARHRRRGARIAATAQGLREHGELSAQKDVPRHT